VSPREDPAPWRPIDCHAHTTFSDGALTVEELVAAARARGVRPSVADHLSGDVALAIRTVEGVRAYLDELERHDVGRGGEFCWHDSLWRTLPDDLWSRLTHAVGSLHAVILPDGGIVHAFSRRVPPGMTPQGYMAVHIENLERMAREMPVDILAHPTLLPLSFRHIPLEEMWTEELEERAVRALAAAGIAMEISSRYRPHERLIRRAHDTGVRLSLGSDGHAPAQVADVAFSLSLARHIGVRDEELYDPFVHGRREMGSGKREAGSRR
jgi:histidinol phosphatase-like PHP family hydrolase